MSKQPIVPTADPAIRSTVYKLLSLGFHYPTIEMFETFQNGKFLEDLWDNISSLPYRKNLTEGRSELAKKVQDDLAGAKISDFEEGFIQTFDVGAPSPPCPPYEGIYLGESRTEIMLKVSQFYKHFGLSMNQEEGKRELPDHLCPELEFLHFLTFKEDQARKDKNPELLKGYMLAQKDFLEQHLIQWIPKFCDKLQNSAGSPFYARLAQITSMFVASDLEWVTSNLEN